MANERKWLGASALLSANGTINGVIAVTSTRGFKVKAKVTLKSNTQTNKEFEIKAIYGKTTIHVGPLSANIEDRSDVSAFLLADSAQIVQYPQKRPTISREDIEKAIYEEEPTVARRVIWVDEFGDKYTESNPVPVSIPGLTVNVDELNVSLDHRQDHPNIGDPPDSVQIGDGVDVLAINPDGSINVTMTSSNPGIVISNYNEITSVATSVLSTILTYTAPVGKVTYLQKVVCSGSNIAEYSVIINSVVRDKKRTFFGGNLNTEMIFAVSGIGLPLAVADVVTIKVIHGRPMVGDFNSRLQVVEI